MIGIIVLLIAILLPVVAKVRIQARVADTQAQINKIVGAIRAYKQDQGAFPGPIPNSAFATGVATSANGMTMTENLVVALCGGWDWSASGGSYVETSVGSGR